MDISEHAGDYNSAIATVLLLRKTEIGKTFDEIAEKAHMGRRTVQRALHGERPMTVPQFVALASALEIEPSDAVEAARLRVGNKAE